MANVKPEKTPLEQWAELEQAHKNALAQIRLDAAKSGNNGYKLKLVEPIMVGSALVSELDFRPQNVSDVRRNPGEDEFVGALCNLTKEQVTQLSLDDWQGAQQVLEGFAMRRAAGGPARSTKAT